ncbi:hypothetical protein HELRODRAFT_183423 [Helobdella robusta]|uniref:Uncharacterized protein n=1 Tax=Helobdella robusta TaxID=6412 RepID=T1FJM3_HELRO|nr:hypothetical protein HELRODRAFT_183423 [Helobdella robusta]ESO11183.1 hypothetical protein HELRODRAFT_183423 [Helobdella robusta]
MLQMVGNNVIFVTRGRSFPIPDEFTSEYHQPEIKRENHENSFTITFFEKERTKRAEILICDKLLEKTTASFNQSIYFSELSFKMLSYAETFDITYNLQGLESSSRIIFESEREREFQLYTWTIVSSFMSIPTDSTITFIFTFPNQDLVMNSHYKFKYDYVLLPVNITIDKIFEKPGETFTLSAVSKPDVHVWNIKVEIVNKKEKLNSTSYKIDFNKITFEEPNSLIEKKIGSYTAFNENQTELVTSPCINIKCESHDPNLEVVSFDIFSIGRADGDSSFYSKPVPSSISIFRTGVYNLVCTLQDKSAVKYKINGTVIVVAEQNVENCGPWALFNVTIPNKSIPDQQNNYMWWFAVTPCPVLFLLCSICTRRQNLSHVAAYFVSKQHFRFYDRMLIGFRFGSVLTNRQNSDLDPDTSVLKFLELSHF